MDRGWVKMHRQLLENVMLMNDNNAYVVFTKLLMLASRKGEYATGRFALSEMTNLRPGTLYSVLGRLEAAKMIKLEPKSKYTIITISNWGQYQGVNTPRNTSLNTNITEENQLQLNTPRNTYDRNTATTRQQHGNTITRIKNKKENSGKVNIDQELAVKEKAAKNREVGSGYKKAASIAEALKLKKFERI